MIEHTAHKARAAGLAGGVAAAAADLIAFHTGLPQAQELSLAIILGAVVPFIWTYYSKRNQVK